jgi:hypothetical protein
MVRLSSSTNAATNGAACAKNMKETGPSRSAALKMSHYDHLEPHFN